MEQLRYTFNFCIKKSRPNAQGQAPIYFRLTIDQDRKERAVNLYVNPKEWNDRLGLCDGKDKYSQSVNSRLNAVRTKMLEIFTALSTIQTPTTTEVVNKFFGIIPEVEPEIKYYLIPLFAEHNKKCVDLVKAGHMAAGTLERYETSLKHTLDFMKHHYNVDDIELCKIDRDFIDEYEFYLKTVRKCSHNTTMKYLKNFRKLILLAIRKKLMEDDPFSDKRLTLEEVHPEFLEEHELSMIIQKEFSTSRLRQVRDVLVFCCQTGLAFSDVKELSKSHISTGGDAVDWIRKRRHKTNVMFNVPLVSQAINIIDKYKDKVNGGYLLPVLSNQKMNEYLKEITSLCGIEKDITTHTGRHTFATFALNNGASLETVAKMLGHTSTKMTARYARVLDKSIKKDMVQVQEAMNALFTQK